MPAPKLLDDFIQNTSDDLLKALLEAYQHALDLPEDQRVVLLVKRLGELFKEQSHEDTQT